MEEHDGIVSLDPNVRPDIVEDRDRWEHFHDRWLTHTHIYKASEEDLAWVWPDRDTESSVARLLEGSVEAVLVMRGPDGVVLLSLADRYDGAEPARLAEVSANEWAAIAHRAACAAALNCSRVGAGPPTRAELDAFLR